MSRLRALIAKRILGMRATHRITIYDDTKGDHKSPASVQVIFPVYLEKESSELGPFILKSDGTFKIHIDSILKE